jgi:hypothetical protein
MRVDGTDNERRPPKRAPWKCSALTYRATYTERDSSERFGQRPGGGRLEHLQRPSPLDLLQRVARPIERDTPLWYLRRAAGPDCGNRAPCGECGYQVALPLRAGSENPGPVIRAEFSPLPRLRPIRIDVVQSRPEGMNHGGICPSCAGCDGRPRRNGFRFRVRSTVTGPAERDEIVECVASSIARLDDVVNGQLRGGSAVPGAVAVSHTRLFAHRLPPALVQVGTVRGHVAQR